MEVQGLDPCGLGLGTGVTMGADTTLCAVFPPIWFLTVTSNASFSSMFRLCQGFEGSSGTLQKPQDPWSMAEDHLLMSE